MPVDGQIESAGAFLDELAVTGEPIPAKRLAGETARSGSINAGETFEMRASATAGESTYAGIVKMVTAAQTAKAPFIRMADRFALILLPVTLVIAGAAWAFSADAIRALAVLVASTPCPLILAAPVAFIAGAVVDLGTATAFDAISAAGEYLGGAITPGVAISLDAAVRPCRRPAPGRARRAAERHRQVDRRVDPVRCPLRVRRPGRRALSAVRRLLGSAPWSPPAACPN